MSDLPKNLKKKKNSSPVLFLVLKYSVLYKFNIQKSHFFLYCTFFGCPGIHQMTTVCLEVEKLKIGYFTSLFWHQECPPKILTSSLLPRSSVLGFKVVQGKVHQGCTVRGHRQIVMAVVLACKGKGKPKGNNDNSASRKHWWEGAASSSEWQPGKLLKHPSSVKVLYGYSIVIV